MQLYGQDPALMAEAARWAVDHGAQTIDINMGCPVDKVTKTFAGSMMLCTPDHTVAVAERLVATVDVPVTAKLRLGYHHNELTAPDLARRLIGVGVRAITIHGRTAEQRFKGLVDLEGIRRVVEAVHDAGAGRVPCIGNGDVKTPFDAVAMIRATGCDGVMIARAALGAPWIFRDTLDLLLTGSMDRQMTLSERIDCLRQHGRHMAELRQERWAANRFRQAFGRYAKHLGPCKSLKAAVQKIDHPDQIDPLLDRFLIKAGDRAHQVPLTWQRRAEQLSQSRPASVRVASPAPVAAL
ncbi:MAG: tRNA-dihydrouridine synthase, partial [Phycisphaeraceae bacterium]|nr:tRNA-dihydrouridine synthase [Phycisphaeraceae bacterium]